MDEILFEILKLLVMIVALISARYLAPWLKSKIGAERLAEAEKWAKYAVLKAQQVMCADSGADRKAYVTQFLREWLAGKNIALSDEQIDILVEAAVKQMKIEESTGIMAGTERNID